MISIIIPVYNSGRYLGRCIESILHQTYSNIELILVDDGSSDNSSEICDQYAAIDSRVKVYHTENRGVSAARNFGLDCAQGEYVAFYDSDDFLRETSSLGQLYAYAMRYDADVVKGNYATFDNTEYWSYPKLQCLHLMERKLSASEFVGEVLRDEFFLWLLLIKRSVIGDVRFVDGRIYLEDMEFVFSLARRITTAIYTPVRHYVYRKHLGAISYKPNPQKIADLIKVMYSILNESSKVAQPLRNVYLNKVSRLYVSCLEMIATDVFFSNRKELIVKNEIEKHREFLLGVLKANVMRIDYMYIPLPIYAIDILFLSNKLKIMIYRMSYYVKRSLGIYK